MVYYANEPYNKQTSNEGFWQSAGYGMGVGAATAAGIAGVAHGTSFGMMKMAQNNYARKAQEINAQQNRAMSSLRRPTEFQAGPNGIEQISPSERAAQQREYETRKQAIKDGMDAQRKALADKFDKSMGGKAQRFYNKNFHSGFKRGAAVYAGSALLGAVTGGAIDYLKDK